MTLNIRDTFSQDIPNRVAAMANRRKTMEELHSYVKKDPSVQANIDAILSMNRERIDGALIALLDELHDAQRIDEGVQAALHAEWIAELRHMSVGAEEGSF